MMLYWKQHTWACRQNPVLPREEARALVLRGQSWQELSQHPQGGEVLEQALVLHAMQQLSVRFLQASQARLPCEICGAGVSQIAFEISPSFTEMHAQKCLYKLSCFLW